MAPNHVDLVEITVLIGFIIVPRRTISHYSLDYGFIVNRQHSADYLLLKKPSQKAVTVRMETTGLPVR